MVDPIKLSGPVTDLGALARNAQAKAAAQSHGKPRDWDTIPWDERANMFSGDALNYGRKAVEAISASNGVLAGIFASLQQSAATTALACATMAVHNEWAGLVKPSDGTGLFGSLPTEADNTPPEPKNPITEGLTFE